MKENNENKTRGNIQGGSTQHLIVAQELKQCRGGWWFPMEELEFDPMYIVFFNRV